MTSNSSSHDQKLLVYGGVIGSLDNDFTPWTGCNEVLVKCRINPDDQKFKRLLHQLEHNPKRWPKIQLDIRFDGSNVQSSPAFVSLLVASIGRTYHLELFDTCIVDLDALSSLNTGLIMEDGLQSLKLKGSWLTRYITVEQMTIFATGLSSADQLKRLVLDYISIAPDVAQALCVGLEHNQSLEKLEFCRCEMDAEAVSAVVDSLSRHQSLKSFVLSCFEVLSTPVQDSFKRWLSSDNCKLEELMYLTHSQYPTNTPFPEFTLGRLERPNRSLAFLSLHYMNLDSSCLEGILSSFPNLRTLDLENNQISDLQSLAHGLLKETSHLERLVLDYNPIENSHMNNFAKRLPEMKVLRSLEIVELPCFGGRGCSAVLFSEYVSMNASLENVRVTSSDPHQYYYRYGMPKAAHSLHLNRAGRRYLGHPGQLPLNLLPLVIQRARRIHYYNLNDPWNEPSLKMNGHDAIFWLLRENSAFHSHCRG